MLRRLAELTPSLSSTVPSSLSSTPSSYQLYSWFSVGSVVVDPWSTAFTFHCGYLIAVAWQAPHVSAGHLGLRRRAGPAISGLYWYWVRMAESHEDDTLIATLSILNLYYEKLMYIDGLVQERRDSIANALNLRLSCIDPSVSRFFSTLGARMISCNKHNDCWCPGDLNIRGISIHGIDLVMSDCYIYICIWFSYIITGHGRDNLIPY